MTGAPTQVEEGPTRQAIVDSARHLFEHQGYERTSVQQIATRAGLTKGAFYHHFKSKLDLLAQIEEEYVDTELAMVSQAVLSEPDPRRRIEAVIRGILWSAASYRTHLSVFHQERRLLADDAFAGIRAKRDLLESVLVAAVEDGVATGAVDPRFDPSIVAYGIIGMCVWTFQWYEPHRQLPVDEVVAQFCDLVFGGLPARTPAPAG